MVYYKCIPRQYYTQGKIIDTNTDNYGEWSRNEYVDIRHDAKFILNSAKETGLPLSLFFFMLAFANGKRLEDGMRLPYILDENFQEKDDEYKISDLVNFPDATQTVKYETLKHYFALAKKTDWRLTNGSLLWEYVAEKVRNEFYPDLPSRLKSYFLFSDKDSANYYRKAHEQKSDFIVVKAELRETISLKTFDMKIWDIDNNNVPYDICICNIRRYWESANLERKDVPEILFQGKLQLLEEIRI